MQTEAAIQKLESLSKYAADELRPLLENATLEQYQAFLDMMYHYTLYSEGNLMKASETAHTDELKEYFEHMAKEEHGHYLLAAKDLEGYGKAVSKETPQEVLNINQYWDEMTQGHVNAFLGLVFVFENIAKHLGTEIKTFLQRLEVTKKQGRWLSVHAEADLEHGEEAKEFAEKYCDENAELMVNSAEKAANLWLAINRKPFATVAGADS